MKAERNQIIRKQCIRFILIDDQALGQLGMVVVLVKGSSINAKSFIFSLCVAGTSLCSDYHGVFTVL